MNLRIRPDGSVDALYTDEVHALASALGSLGAITRVSTVEWESVDGRSGWVVRSSKNPEIALRVTDWCRWEPRTTGTIVTFQNREQALEEEKKFAWSLKDGKEMNDSQKSI